ncbi:MAG: hypothetical protein IPJ88_05120 [Myxococcales bacterium]|nr:MAG: hypothetical protein IPJ88_05120 [Myxococcales bacterium]
MKRQTHRKEEGAAMLIVMLILLMSTATATFAIQSTGLEIRSAGHERQAIQTHYITEAGIESAMSWVDQTSPNVLAHIMASSTAPALTNEPSLLSGKQGFRLTLADFAVDQSTQSANHSPIEIGSSDNSLGHVPYQPTFTVDVNDNYTYTGTVPGYRLDGGGALKYMVATYTIRGRTYIPQTGQSSDKVSAMDSVSVGRVIARSGPMAK